MGIVEDDVREDSPLVLVAAGRVVGVDKLGIQGKLRCRDVESLHDLVSGDERVGSITNKELVLQRCWLCYVLLVGSDGLGS